MCMSLQGKELIATMKGECSSNPTGINLQSLTPCSQEEADTRMFLHLAAAVTAGHTNVLMRTVDSDIVCLAPRAVVLLLSQGLKELWIAFGSGKHFR